MFRLSAALSLALATGCATPAHGQRPPTPSPEDLLLWDAPDLARARKEAAAGTSRFVAARDAVLRKAEAALTAPILPVTSNKTESAYLAPTGDPRDYVSLSPYWWPDPDQEDGLPYVRRDGEINPDRANYDANKLAHVGECVLQLSIAYFLTGDERYAKRASDHLRTWFLAAATRMNPNFQHAQFRPGQTEGSPSGMIESLRIRWLPDCAALLLSSKHWSRSDHDQLGQWFSELLDWMLTSKLGKKERKAKNNHGSWYASQAIKFATIAKRDDVAREILQSIPDRIADQIAEDGSQPYEMARTRSLGYHDFNLRALLDLSVLARRHGTDLLQLETEKGRSLRLALDFALPRMTGEKPWPGKQIAARRLHNQFQMFRIAARVFGEPRYETAARELQPDEDSHAWMDIALPPPLLH